ncbi:Rv3654c family TadE-like protein [Streptomyces sp. NPDC002516]
MRSRSRRLVRGRVWSPVWGGCRAWRRTRWRVSSDRGSATVWAVGAIAVLCAVFGAVLSMGQVVVVRHRAAGAADLAALAAADHWSDGGASACARAERVALAQGARLVRCEIEGQISDVTAASGTGPITAEVRSRAGPPGLAEPPASEAPQGFRPSGSYDLPSRPGRPSPRPWPPHTRHSPVRP